MMTGVAPRQNVAFLPSSLRSACIGFCCLLAATGCNSQPKDMPKIAPVKGTVTMDGEPLPHVDVTFFSEEGGQVAGGTTNDAGGYELRFSGRHMGAKIGPNTVRITTPPSPEVPGAPAWKEKVPAKYNSKSQLKADVKPGPEPNTFDFELTSKK
jgi:hypothetical protein